MENGIPKSELQLRRITMGISLAAFVILALLANVASEGKFLTQNNISNILVGATIPIFTAWGFSFIFACNVVDFSVGAVIILSATVAGTFGNEYGIPAVILGGIIVGVVLLFINFQVYTITKIPSWIAAMGMTMIYESVTLIYSNSRLKQGMQVVTLDNSYRKFGQSPYIFIVLVIGLVFAYLLYNKTTIGLNIRAIGSNLEVAKLMGISSKKTLIYGGIISGLFVGCAGFLTESYAGRVIGVTGLTSVSTVFQPIAAVLLAQVMKKYINLMIAIPIATVLITAIFNIMTLIGIQSGTWQQVALGIIVILFGIIAQRHVKETVK